jgi:hypothetical protein
MLLRNLIPEPAFLGYHRTFLSSGTYAIPSRSSIDCVAMDMIFYMLLPQLLNVSVEVSCGEVAGLTRTYPHQMLYCGSS